MLFRSALADKGYIVTVHDPLAQEAALNVLGEKALGASSLESAVSDADLLVVATGWPEYKEIDVKWCQRLWRSARA